MSVIISEAFKKLNLISEDTFELNDEGIDELKQFNDSDEADDTVNIIDPDAESEEDLDDSYVGKVILDCEVCHSKIYKDAEDVKIEDGAELANIDEECPFCYTTDGYKVIGQVSNFKPLDDIKVEVEDEDGDGQAEVKVKAEESLKSRKSCKCLKESFYYDYVNLVCDDCGEEWTDDLGGVDSEDELYDLAANETCPECGGSNVYLDYVEGADEDFDESCKPRRKSTKESFKSRKGLNRRINKDLHTNEGFNEALVNDDDGDYSSYTARVDGSNKRLMGRGEKDGLALRKITEFIKSLSQEEKDGFRLNWRWDEDFGDGEGDVVVSVYSANEVGPDEDRTMSNWSYAENKIKYNLGLREGFNEALDEVSLTADGQKYTIKAEPNEEIPGEEVISPIAPEVENEITANSEGEADVEVDEFSEEEFNDLGESYLKEVYDNVKSYKTSRVASRGNKLTVEGIITFKSGKQKKTQFVFEAKDITKRGKARFIGENKQICRGSKAFTLTGSIKSGKFLSESFNYNYRASNGKAGSKRVYGTIKRKLGV